MPSRRTRLDLRWALGLALLLHVVALGAASRLSLARAATQGDLSEVRVFDAPAPASIIPFDMVTLPVTARAQTSAEPKFEPALPVPDPITPPAPKRTSPTQPEAAARGAAATTAPSRPVTSRSAVPTPQTPGARPSPAGGGEAGPVSLGPTSPSGTIPVPAATPEAPRPGTTPGGGAGQEGARGGEGASSQTTGSGGSGKGNDTGEGSGSTGKGHAGETPKTGEGDPGNDHADRSQPKVVQKAKQVYPEEAAAEGVEGTTVLTVLVTETGTVAEVKVERGSGDRRLDRAAMDCVRRWRYLPAVQNGQPRRVYTRATVSFKLK
jgi:periplasmic protein TonB